MSLLEQDDLPTINALHVHVREPCFLGCDPNFKLQARAVRKADNAIHRINHYPVDSVVCFVNTYPLDSDLSGG